MDGTTLRCSRPPPVDCRRVVPHLCRLSVPSKNPSKTTAPNPRSLHSSASLPKFRTPNRSYHAPPLTYRSWLEEPFQFWSRPSPISATQFFLKKIQRKYSAPAGTPSTLQIPPPCAPFAPWGPCSPLPLPPPPPPSSAPALSHRGRSSALYLSAGVVPPETCWARRGQSLRRPSRESAVAALRWRPGRYSPARSMSSLVPCSPARPPRSSAGFRQRPAAEGTKRRRRRASAFVLDCFTDCVAPTR